MRASFDAIFEAIGAAYDRTVLWTRMRFAPHLLWAGIGWVVAAVITGAIWGVAGRYHYPAPDRPGPVDIFVYNLFVSAIEAGLAAVPAVLVAGGAYFYLWRRSVAALAMPWASGAVGFGCALIDLWASDVNLGVYQRISGQMVPDAPGNFWLWCILLVEASVVAPLLAGWLFGHCESPEEQGFPVQSPKG